jgi:hypothetical protein
MFYLTSFWFKTEFLNTLWMWTSRKIKEDIKSQLNNITKYEVVLLTESETDTAYLSLPFSNSLPDNHMLKSAAYRKTVLDLQGHLIL